MYDPQMGRFIQEDPEGFEAGDFNIYRYANNIPTTLVDPSGLQPPRGERDVTWFPCRINGDETFTSTFGDTIHVAYDYFLPREVRDLKLRLGDLRHALGAVLADLQPMTELNNRGVREPIANPPYRFSLFERLTNEMQDRIYRWFSGDGFRTHAELENNEMQRIYGVFKAVQDSFNSSVIEFENDPPSRSADSRNYAWVWRPLGFWSDIHLTRYYYRNLPSPRMRDREIFHEMTHRFADTDDIGYIQDDSFIRRGVGLRERFAAPHYYSPDGDGTTDILMRAPSVQRNADTYAGFLFDYYLGFVENAGNPV